MFPSCSEDHFSSAVDVLWSGDGVVVQLVNSQWTLMGEKAVHKLKVVKIKGKHMIVSDLTQKPVLVDSYCAAIYF